MAETSLEKLERQYEQARARLQAARARQAAKDRKLDARRKIILGGALIERAGRDPEAARLIRALVTGLSRVQDRKAFENWTPPAPKAEGSAEDSTGDAMRKGADGAGAGSVSNESAGMASAGRGPVTDADATGPQDSLP